MKYRLRVNDLKACHAGGILCRPGFPLPAAGRRIGLEECLHTALSEHVGGRDSFPPNPEAWTRGAGPGREQPCSSPILPSREEGGLSVWICVPEMSLLGQPPAPPRASPHGPTSCRDSWGSLWGRWGVPCRRLSTPLEPLESSSGPPASSPGVRPGSGP